MDNEQNLPEAEISLFATSDENGTPQAVLVIENAEIMNVGKDEDGNTLIGDAVEDGQLCPVPRFSYDEGCKFIMALKAKLKEAVEQYGDE